MGKCTFAYGNLTDSSTLSGGSWSPALSNLQSRELAAYAESATNLATIDIDHGTAKAAQVFGLFAHNNVDTSSTITVTRGATSGGSDIYAGSALSCWPFTPTDYAGSQFGIIVVAPQSTTARYTRIVVSMTSGTLRVGRLFVGPMVANARNVVGLANDWMQDFSQVDRTEAGADWATARPRLRHAVLEFAALSAAEASTLHEIQRTHGTTGEVVYLPDIDDRAHTQQYGFLGLMRALSKLEYVTRDLSAIAIAIDERGGAP